jgi:AraC-like DNA-binding protein
LPNLGEPVIGSAATGAFVQGGPGTQSATTDDCAWQLLRLPTALLSRRLEALLDGRQVDDQTRGAGATLRRMLDFLLAELEHSDSLLSSEIAIRGFEEDLALCLLLGLPHDYTAALARQKAAAAPGNVRKAEAFMRAHADTPLTILEIAAAAGCGVRALQIAFQRFRGTTPMRALQQARLEQARQEIVRLDRTESLARVAAAHGFGNPTRFARLFRRRYGLYPSEMPRRAARPARGVAAGPRPALAAGTGSQNKFVLCPLGFAFGSASSGAGDYLTRSVLHLIFGRSRGPEEFSQADGRRRGCHRRGGSIRQPQQGLGNKPGRAASRTTAEYSVHPRRRTAVSAGVPGRGKRCRRISARFMPNTYALWRRGVKFAGHYSASTACSPARGTLVNGLYSQQNWLLLTILDSPDVPVSPQPALRPEFPTYGKLLREAGYQTPYIGKWHLSVPRRAPGRLDEYGFDGLTYPDPTGSNLQGTIGDEANGYLNDADIATQAAKWLARRKPGEEPWCLTVGFVDIGVKRSLGSMTIKGTL